MAGLRRDESAKLTPAAVAGLVLVASAIACRSAVEAPRTPQAKNIPHVLVFAPGPQPVGSPVPDSPDRLPEPTAAYPSLQAACAVVNAVMEAKLAVEIKRADSVPYENEFVGGRRIGCEFKAAGKFSARPDTVGSLSVDGDVAAGLTAAGWTDIPRYTADGPDGSAFGLRSRETVCLFRASWDGGDDSDTTYVPSDEWELVGHCALWEPSDST
jgi:hypothetical protein